MSSNSASTNLTGGAGVQSSSNVGTGQGLALAKIGSDLPFKSLVQGTNISLVGNTNDVTISLSQLPALGTAPSPPRQTIIVNSEISTVDTSKITTGTMNTARLGSGTASSLNFLRGDNTWQSVALDTSAVYAQLSDQSNQVPGVTTPVKITFDTNDALSGISHSTSVNPENITINEDGVYFIYIAPQVGRTGGTLMRYLDFWLRLNAVDVSNSNVRISLAANALATDVIGAQISMSLAAGDILNIMMSVEAISEGLGIYRTAPAGESAIPSVIFTIFKLKGMKGDPGPPGNLCKPQ